MLRKKQIPNLTNQVLVAWLRSLVARSTGPLTKEYVVREAKKKSAPPAVHKHFEWNNTIAARLYRLEQAGELLRRAKTKVVIEETILEIPAFVHVPQNSTNVAGYSPVEVVKSPESAYDPRETMLEEVSRLNGNLSRMLNLAEFFETRDLVEDIARKVEVLARVVDTWRPEDRLQ